MVKNLDKISTLLMSKIGDSEVLFICIYFINIKRFTSNLFNVKACKLLYYSTQQIIEFINLYK